VFGPQTTAPTSCATGGTQVGAAVTVSGNTTYNPRLATRRPPPAPTGGTPATAGTSATARPTVAVAQA
jgi:hypothetical protein